MRKTDAFEEIKSKGKKDDISESESQKQRNKRNNEIEKEWIIWSDEINFNDKAGYLVWQTCKSYTHKIWMEEFGRININKKNQCGKWRQEIK